MMTIARALSESFHQGGWPMFPILILGILQIIAAARYAAHPESRQLQLVRCVGMVTLGFGFLGTMIGMIYCLRSMEQVPQELVVKISLLGLGESMNNLAQAFLLSIIAGLLVTVGALREASRGPADPR